MHQDIIKDKVNDGYKPVTLEAHDLVFGDRQKSYGHPLDDFSCTATCWDAYLKHRMHSKLRANWKGSDTDLLVFLRWFDEYFGVDAEDFGPMMILAKVSRQANSPKRDNMTDSAGYAETTERVIFERERRRDPRTPFAPTRSPSLGRASRRMSHSTRTVNCRCRRLKW
jgi:transposase-like protein